MKLSKLAIIAGDVTLAEQVCAHLRKPGIYLPVFEAPLKELEEYGVFENDCIRLANAIRALPVRKVLFLKVESDIVSKLRSFFPWIESVTVDFFDERRLAIDLPLSKSPIGFRELQASNSDLAGELFAVERNLGIAPVIAGNLAVAHGGKVLELSETSESDLDGLKEYFRLWSRGTYEERKGAMETCLSFVRTRLPEPLTRVKTDKPLSFITRGVPYGLYPFDRPTTHYFPFVSLGRNVCAGMLKSLSIMRNPIVVLFDPNKVGQSEFDCLRERFGSAGYHLRLAYGDNATVTSAIYLTERLPSDFIFFSTHCGEVDGRRILERFPARNGTYHEICYDRIISASPTPEFIANPSPDGLFQVMFLFLPISMDGVSWNDCQGKERIEAGDLLRDFLEHAQNHKEHSEARQFLSNVESRGIKGFEGLQMADGFYLPVHEDVGGCHYPVVFNNACCSWRTLAKNYGCSGASVYIGTATDVLNIVATESASSFAKAVTSGKSIGIALFRAQHGFTKQFGYTPYLMHGYFYTKLNNPDSRLGPGRVRERCVEAIAAASRLPESVRKASIITFLKQELEGLSRISHRLVR